MKALLRANWISVLILFGGLALSIVLSTLQLISPTALPADAPADEFSAERVMQHVQAMDVGPHWTGSVSNTQIRDYLLKQLKSSGLEAEVHSADALQPEYLTAAHLENVVARLPGSDGSKAILFVVHYDSVASGPGASYHAYNGTLLEIARALAASPQLKNDVIFLFTDAEEWGFLGAKAFIEGHPWMSKVALVFEGIPRGNGGPVFLGTTSDENGWFMREFINAVPYPLVHSFARDAYAQIPGGGDFEEFDKKDVPGALITWEKGQITYHAATDSIQHLNPDNIQHLGSYFLGLAGRFGNLDLNQIPQTGNLTFFNLISHVVVRYANSLVIPLNLAAVGLFIATLIHGFRRAQFQVKGITLGFGAFLLTLIAAEIIALLLWFLITLTHPSAVGMVAKIPYNADTYTVAFIAFLTAWFIMIFGWVRKRIGLFNVAAGSLAWWALLSITTAFVLQGGNYIFLWPLVFGTLALFYGMQTQTNQPKDALIFSLLAAPPLLILVPVFYLTYISLLWVTGVPGVIPILVVLVLGLLFPHFDLLSQVSRLSWLLALFTGMGLVMVLVGVFTAQPATDQPRDIHLVYGLDTDTNTAYWFSNDPTTSWVSQVFTGTPEAGRFNSEFYGSDGLQETASFMRVKVSQANLPAPSVEVLENNTSGKTRILKLQITSGRGANMLNVFASPETTILSARLNGRDFFDGEGTFSFPFWGAPKEGIELTLIVPASESVTLIVSDLTPGFPQLDGITISPRPPGWIMPPNGGYYFSDSTWVRKTFTFP